MQAHGAAQLHAAIPPSTPSSSRDDHHADHAATSWSRPTTSWAPLNWPSKRSCSTVSRGAKKGWFVTEAGSRSSTYRVHFGAEASGGTTAADTLRSAHAGHGAPREVADTQYVTNRRSRIAERLACPPLFRGWHLGPLTFFGRQRTAHDQTVSASSSSPVRHSTKEMAVSTTAAANPMETFASGKSERCWPKSPTDCRWFTNR